MILKYDEIKVKKKLLITKGEIVIKNNELSLLKGKNGSGKTLLLKNIFSSPENKGISKVLIDQNNDAIFTSRTVLENISMSLDPKRNKEIESQLKDMGFFYLLNRNTAKLSGGEKRIIGILRGLISDVEFVLIDEPTNDLDFVKVEELLKMIQKQLRNKTILIISHDDRFEVSKSHIFRVEDNKVRRSNEWVSENETNQESTINQFHMENKHKFVRKIFNYNYVSVILCLIFAFVIAVQMVSFRLNNEREIPVMRENQIDIFTIGSREISSRPGESMLPFSLLRIIYDGNPFEIMEEVERAQNHLINLNSKVILDLESTSRFTVYNMKFMDRKEGMIISSLDQYLEKYYGKSTETAIINTEAYFSWEVDPSYHQNLPSFNLDIERFKKVIEELNLQTIKNDGKLEVVAIAIILEDGYSFREFLQSEDAKRLAEGAFFISSNEVIELIEESRKLRNTRRMVTTIVLVAAVVLLVEGINTGVYLNLKKNSIVNMKNFSIERDKVIKRIQEKFNSRFHRFAFILVVLFIATQVFKGLTFSPANYYFVAVFLLLMNMVWSLNNMIIKRMVKNIYKWRFR